MTLASLGGREAHRDLHRTGGSVGAGNCQFG
jgi:hypothetical protein